MNILIACEFSGIVRDAFLARGHNAISCDFLPSERPGPHIQGDVKNILKMEWDMLIAHPPCTFLCNSGSRWMVDNPDRQEECRKAARFFLALLNARSIPLRAVENPIPHKYAMKYIKKKYDQIVHPWQFGHGETKSTCLWLTGLPPLIPTGIVDAREPKIHRASPGPNRWKERSRTYTGMAEAMAQQWG